MSSVSSSTYATMAGIFAGWFALFGGFVGIVQPSMFFHEKELSPFYDWLFSSSAALSLRTTSQKATILGIIELGISLTVLLRSYNILPGPQNSKQQLHKLPGLIALTIFYATDMVGHIVVQDRLVPIATTLYMCSFTALVNAIVTEGGSNNKNLKTD